MATQHNIDADSLLTSRQAGTLLQVDPTSIKNWVKAGRLSAFRTPGGHLRIRAEDLVLFLDNHDMPIPKGLRALTRRRLLIVDDDPKQLASIARLLRPYSDVIDVELVENGIDALVRVGSFRPDLVVLDVFMPAVDGIEVCRRLKTNEETAQIDVVIASGRLSDEIEERALNAGARRCIRKPFDLEVILQDLGVVMREQAS